MNVFKRQKVEQDVSGIEKNITFLASDEVGTVLQFGTKRVSRLEQLRLARINRGNGDTELPTAGSRGDASDAPPASAPVAVPVGNSARETRKLRLM